MADAFTSLLQLLKQETGNNNNNWGVLLNTQVIDRVEQAIAGSTYITTTGGTTTLTDDQARSAILVIQGALVSNAIIEVPAHTKLYKLYNSTTGAFSVSIKVVGQTAYVLQRNTLQDLMCDGTTIFDSSPGQVPIGSSVFHWSATVPANFFEMNGQAVSRTLYPKLFAEIGTTWGVGDGTTTFNVPNATGRYMRGRGNFGNGTGNLAIGYLAQDYQSHTHTASSGVTGSHNHTGSSDTEVNHTHTYHNYQDLIGVSFNAGGATGAWSPITSNTGAAGSHNHALTINANGDHSHSVTVNASGNIETRPNSIIGVACIRYQ